jgi:hypothetical protein
MRPACQPAPFEPKGFNQTQSMIIGFLAGRCSRAVLLADAGGRAPDANAVRCDVAEYRVVAASCKLADRSAAQRIRTTKAKGGWIGVGAIDLEDSR